MSVVCFPKLGAKLKPPWNLKSCERSMQILLDIQLVWKAIESQPTNRTFNLYYVGMYLPTTVAGMLVASALPTEVMGILYVIFSQTCTGMSKFIIHFMAAIHL